MTTTQKFAVLEDNTRDADVIGYAETEDQAAQVWLAYNKERMDPEDFETLTAPTFAYRNAPDNASGEEAFEPIW